MPPASTGLGSRPPSSGTREQGKAQQQLDAAWYIPPPGVACTTNKESSKDTNRFQALYRPEHAALKQGLRRGSGQLSALIHRSAWKGNSANFALTAFSELRSKGVGLLLYHRLCRPSRGYGIGVAMHYLPVAAFGPKEDRNPQSERRDVLPASDLGIPLF